MTAKGEKETRAVRKNDISCVTHMISRWEPACMACLMRHILLRTWKPGSVTTNKQTYGLWDVDSGQKTVDPITVFWHVALELGPIFIVACTERIR